MSVGKKILDYVSKGKKKELLTKLSTSLSKFVWRREGFWGEGGRGGKAYLITQPPTFPTQTRVLPSKEGGVCFFLKRRCLSTLAHNSHATRPSFIYGICHLHTAYSLISFGKRALKPGRSLSNLKRCKRSFRLHLVVSHVKTHLEKV